MRNLVVAFEESRGQNIDRLQIFDNSEKTGHPRLILSLFGGIPWDMAEEIPTWLVTALAASAFNIPALRALMTH